ncbi:MAG TPA: hypothetical protein VGP33_17175 [Chloroflexota bacterium]|jgi:hypothetical protein|nr:hypothetical protein [Chloroflexota bacterium]
MARLQFDADSGCYVGARLVISGNAMSRRIRQLTEAPAARDLDPVAAAEAAWNVALEENSWAAGEDGASGRCRQGSPPTGASH